LILYKIAVKLVALFAIIFHINYAQAGTAWLPDKNEHFLGFSYSRITGFDRDVLIEKQKYDRLQNEIHSLRLAKLQLIEKHKVPNVTIKSRVEIIDKKIESLENRKKLLRKDFGATSQNYYIERGINKNYSFGINASGGSSVGFLGSSNFIEADIFLKRKIYKNKKWMISAELGPQFESCSSVVHSLVRVNMARVKVSKKHQRKYITEMSVATRLNQLDDFIISEFRQTIEFKNGYSIQLGSYAKVNNKLHSGYRYYYKDQLIVAKAISSDIIPLPDKTTISFGLYQEYFHKERKKAGNGFQFGIWVRI